VPRLCLELKPWFASIFGAQATGKSYLLAAMTHTLRRRLPAGFNISFTDSDASANQYLVGFEHCPRRAAGKGGTASLILGLLLGTMLIVAAVCLVELISEDWMFAKLGMKSEPAKKLDEATGKLADIGTELGVERTRSDNLRNDKSQLESDLRKKSAEYLQEKSRADGLQLKITDDAKKPPAVIEKPVPAAGSSPLDLLVQALVYEVRLQQEIDKALAARGPAAAGPVRISSIILEKIDPAGTMVPGLAVANPAARLDAVGFLDTALSFPWDANAKQVRIAVDPGYAALFQLKDGGVSVSMAATRTDIQSFGHALLRVDHGDGRVEYVQFFRREFADSNTLTASRKTDDAGATFSIERYNLPAPEKLGKLAGRNARVKIGNEIFHLDVVRNGAIENRAVPNGPTITLRVDRDKILVDVKGRDATNLSIEQLEIVRVLPPVKELSFPGCEQELLRYFPFKK